MSHVAKLSLAVALALVAAVLNAMWLRAEKQPTTFVAVNADVQHDQLFTDELLMGVPIPGDAERLSASLVPYSRRSLLYGLKASRDYIRGDMVFQRDIEAPRELSRFEVLGPFKLISVGERFKTSRPDQDAEVNEGGNNVTIAVSADFDERTRRLLEIIDPSRRGNSQDSALRIVAIQVIPPNERTATSPGDDKNLVYQTVSLNGIDSVPRVLLEGDVIRFVVPANDSL